MLAAKQEEPFVTIFMYHKYPKISTAVLHSKKVSNLSFINYFASVTFSISRFQRLLQLSPSTSLCAPTPSPNRGGSSATAHGTQLTESSFRNNLTIVSSKKTKSRHWYRIHHPKRQIPSSESAFSYLEHKLQLFKREADMLKVDFNMSCRKRENCLRLVPNKDSYRILVHPVEQLSKLTSAL